MAVGDLFRFRFAKHSTTSFGGAATNREKLNEANNNYIARDTDFIQGVSTGFVADITSQNQRFGGGNFLQHGNSSSNAFRGKKTLFQFPLTIEEGRDLSQGHYVNFYVNEQNHSQMKFAPTQKQLSQTALRDNYNISKYQRIFNTNGDIEEKTVSNVDQFANLDSIDVNSPDPYSEPGRYISMGRRTIKSGSKGSGQDTTYVNRSATTRTAALVSLYMPASASYTQNVGYTDTEIGSGAMLLSDIVGGIIGGGGTEQAMRESVENLGATVGEGLLKTSLDAVGALPGLQGIRQAAEISTGAVVTDRLELAFTGLEKRSFSFEFKMMPKSAREVQEVEGIINLFRFNAAPEFVGGNRAGRKMNVPNTFDIQYMYGGRPNQHLGRISTCILKDVNHTYGGDRYRTFKDDGKGTPPTEYTLSLTFQELELITRERIAEGF
tara:strand:+ start:69 stop:1379 length:1311 start_codon:yes stop_codon:yes gene_type:complete